MKKKISGAMESYLECIAELQEKNGAVRTSDLAEMMGFKLPSVTNALRKLSEKGYINYKAYCPVTLTIKGQEMISRLSRYHSILADFLCEILLIDRQAAEIKACQLEHIVSAETLERIEMLMKFVRSDNGSFRLSEHQKLFNDFLKKGST